MGYVVQREGRWYAVGYEGIHPTTGGDLRRWHRVADEEAARAAAASLPGRPRRDRSQGITLARFLRCQWLPPKRNVLKPSTFYRYEAMSEAYLLPHLGRIPLRALTSTHLEHLYALLQRRKQAVLPGLLQEPAQLRLVPATLLRARRHPSADPPPAPRSA
jgi:hypothetical protein